MDWFDGWDIDSEGNRLRFNPRVTQINGKDYVPLSDPDPRFPGSGTPQSYLSNQTIANALDKMPDAFTQGPDGKWYMSAEAQGKASDVLGVRDHGLLDKLLTMSPMILGGIMTGAALGGAFPGVGASGAIPAGETGIFSQLGISNPFGSISGSGGSNALIGGEGADTLGGMTIDQLRNVIGPDFVQNIPGISSAAGATALPGITQGSLAAAAKGFGFSDIASALAKVPVSTLLSAAANIGGALVSSNAIGNASKAQQDAVTGSNALLSSIYQQNRADLEPWRQAGVNALGRLQTGLQPGGELYKSFTLNDFTKDPGYGFRLDEGMKALERSAAARGGLLSGAALKGITRYGQDFASNEYGNAYNRYNQDQTNKYNKLAALSGVGQTAAQQVNQAGQNYGNQASQNVIGAGNSSAAATIGQSNALTGGINNALNQYNQQALINQLLNRSSY